MCSHVPLHAPPPPAPILNTTLSPLLKTTATYTINVAPVPRPNPPLPAAANSSTIPAMPGSVYAQLLLHNPGHAR